jgi:uncharacterized protein
METSARPLVLFHAQCVDGAVAAWVAWRRHNDRADYVAMRYGDPPPDCTDRLVYILDFSFSPNVLTRIADQAKRVINIDHHETAVGNYAAWTPRPDVELKFDVTRSGAGLTADHFGSAHWITEYAEDGDLYRFALPQSREVGAVLAAACLGYAPLDAFRALDTLLGQSRKTIEVQGRGALLSMDSYARQVAAEAAHVTFAGYPRIPIVNCSRPYRSAVTHLLAKDALFGVSWRMERDKALFSLRSDGLEPFNVAKLCEQFGGGGHRTAASFSIVFSAPEQWAEVLGEDANIFQRQAAAAVRDRS